MLGLLVVAACGSSSPGRSSPATAPEAGSAAPAIRLAPSCPTQRAACGELAIQQGPDLVRGRKHGLFVLGSSVLWSDGEAIGIDSACPGGPRHVLPDSAKTTILTAATAGSLSVIVGVHTTDDGRRYQSELVSWIDRGSGFVKAPPLSDRVMTNTRARAAVNAAGRIGIVWFDGTNNSDVMFTVLEEDGTPRSSKLGSLSSIFSYRDLALVAVPSGGWMVLLSGKGLEEQLLALRIDANGSVASGQGRGFGVEVFRQPYGRLAVTWDGTAVAIAAEWGDYGRPAYSPSGSCRGCGVMHMNAVPDTHEIRFVRIDETAKPLAPAVTFSREDDLIYPASLLFVDGAYVLAGEEGFSANAPASSRTKPRVLRFDVKGRVTGRASLGEVAQTYLGLALEGDTIRGAMTENEDGVRPFTVSCATAR